MCAKFRIKKLSNCCNKNSQQNSQQNPQQNYIFFPIQDLINFTNEQKAELIEKIKNGTILNTVLVTPDNYNIRILGYRSIEEFDYYSILYYNYDMATIIQQVLCKDNGK